MRRLIDQQIAERAPWIAAETPQAALARPLLHKLLSYEPTVALANRLKHSPTPELMAEVARLIARDIEATGLSHIPRHGPALIVANHPTGIADGIVLHHLIAALRPDLFIYANSDILRVMPQMTDLILPVEWRAEKRCHAKTRETMKLTAAALQDGRLGVIFPAGRLAKRRGLRLYERDWMPSAAMIARKFDVPVIPINIQARNSALFYLFDRIHPSLRDITLFHETLNKHRQPYRIRVGEPISPRALSANSNEGIALLKRACLALGRDHSSTVSLIRASRWARYLPHSSA